MIKSGDPLKIKIGYCIIFTIPTILTGFGAIGGVQAWMDGEYAVSLLCLVLLLIGLYTFKFVIDLPKQI